MEINFSYTAVIRTLGTAGDKYQKLLNSLIGQTIRPSKIIVYIAEGFDLPKETIGCEQYVYVKKGMVSQRALQYNEVETDYVLFLDDDLEFPEDTIEKMFNLLIKNKADVISPDIFPNANRPLLSEFIMTLSGRMRARRNDNRWGYKVMRTAGYSYNRSPQKEVYWSQTNAGACFLCTKQKFLEIHFEDELWLDEVSYPLGEDQVMYYKMFLKGMKQLTWYNHHVEHLDAGKNMTPIKKANIIYSDFRFKTIFWHRFLYLTDNSLFSRVWSLICLGYALGFTLFISFVKFDKKIFLLKLKAIKDAISFIKSDEYLNLPLIKKII